MASKKPKLFSGITPAGTFKYPHLTEDNIDYGTDAFPKKEGEFNVKLILDADDAEKLRSTLTSVMKQAGADGTAKDKLRKPAQRKKSPFVMNELGTPVYDEDENETGEVMFNFRTTYSGERDGKPWKKTIGIFDAKRKPLTKVAIWGGTVGKVAYQANPYFVSATGSCGVSLYLSGVQILDLVTAGQRTADSYGFEDEEGYEGADDDDTGHGFGDEDGYEGGASDAAEDDF